MALGTVTINQEGVFGDRRYCIADINLTSGANYTSGGEAVTPALLNFTEKVDMISAENVSPYIIDAVPSGVNVKLAVWQGAAGANTQVASNTDLSAVTTRVFAVGK